jgi:uncharacterized protein (DUF983 family)
MKDITTKTAIFRGFASRCPSCGKGKMFERFIKVANNCSSCGEELHHQRADDLPAYLTLILVGHIFVPLMLWALVAFENWPDWLHMVIWLPVFIILSLALLQPVKGAIVAFQWINGMHGFATAKDNRSKS